jgi:FkbM family methyltransferase
VYSYHARHFCDHVYALEAHPALIAPLGRILGTRGTVLHLAASNEEGTARLTIPFKNGRELDTRSSLEADANPGFDLQSIEVETRRIDGLGLGPVGVVKIDVEGHEHAVLEGAEETLLRDKPIVIVECEERHHVGGVERTFGFFDRLGYDGYFLQREVLRSARDFDAAAMQDIAKASSGSVRTGEYINNFIFIHPTDTQRLSLLKTRYR